MLLFDLDNTLYPQGLGVVPRIDQRINDYLERRCGFASAEVDAVRRRFWAEHGTTLRGLMLEHSIDASDYLEYVHDIDLGDLLQPDHVLRELLERMPGRKAVFSNASRTHVDRVLDRLGLQGCFEATIALEDLGYVPKPDPAAFRTALARLGAEGSGCALIDDSRANLACAKRLGMRTVWVAERATGEAADDSVDHVVSSVHDVEFIFGAPATRG